MNSLKDMLSDVSLWRFIIKVLYQLCFCPEKQKQFQEKLNQFLSNWAVVFLIWICFYFFLSSYQQQQSCELFLKILFSWFQEKCLSGLLGKLMVSLSVPFLPWVPYRISEMLKNFLFPFTSFTISCHVLLTFSSKESSRPSKPIGLEREEPFM